MSEIFKRTQLNFGGAFPADKGVLLLNGGLSPVLMQNLGLNYSQMVSRLYELGVAGATANFYYIGGRSQGSANIGQVIGPPVQLSAFFQKYGDVCQAGQNDIGLSLFNSCAANPATGALAGTFLFPALTMKYCVLQGVGAAVGAQDLIISNTNQIMFSNLDYSGQ